MFILNNTAKKPLVIGVPGPGDYNYAGNSKHTPSWKYFISYAESVNQIEMEKNMSKSLVLVNITSEEANQVQR